MLRVTDTERPRRSLVHGERILSGNRVLLPGLGDVVVVLVSQVAAPDLEVVPGVHLAVVDVLGQTVGHGGGPHEQPVVSGTPPTQSPCKKRFNSFNKKPWIQIQKV